MGRVTVIDNVVLPNRPGRCEADWLHDLEFEIWTALQEADMALVAQATVRLLVDGYPYPLIDDDLFQNYWKCVPCIPAEVPTTNIRLLGGKSYGDPPGLCPDFFMSDETRLTLFVDFPDGISEAINLVTKFRRWRYTTTPPLDCLLRPGAYYPRDARIVPVVSNCARALEPVVTSMSVPRAPDAAEMSQPPRPKMPPEFAAVIDEPGCQAIPVKFIGCADAALQVAVEGTVVPQEEDMALIGLQSFSISAGVTREAVYNFLGIAPEPRARLPVGRAGTLQRLVINVTVNTLATGLVVRLFVNGAATGTSVSYGAGETGVKTAAGGVAVVAEDEVSFEIAGTGIGLQTAEGKGSVEFVPD